MSDKGTGCLAIETGFVLVMCMTLPILPELPVMKNVFLHVFVNESGYLEMSKIDYTG